MRSNAGVEGFFVRLFTEGHRFEFAILPLPWLKGPEKVDPFFNSHLSALICGKICGKYFSSSNRSSVQETFPADLRRFFRR
jgi:hypothetical protein